MATMLLIVTVTTLHEEQTAESAVWRLQRHHMQGKPVLTRHLRGRIRHGMGKQVKHKRHSSSGPALQLTESTSALRCMDA